MKNLYFIKSISILAATLIYSSHTNAQLVSCNVFLQGNYIEVGVNISGAFGTSVNAPTGYHARPFGGATMNNTCTSTCSETTNLGFVADPNRTGWSPALDGTGYFGDYFLPGDPQEGWSVESNGHESDAWNANSDACGLSLFTSGMTGTNISYTSAGSTRSGTWQGMNSDGLQITQVTSLDTANVFFTMHITLKNTTAATVTNVYYLRTVDPDNDVTLTGGGFSTVNSIVYQLPNALGATLVSATGVVYPSVWLGLGTLDCRARCFYMYPPASLMPTVSVDSLYNELSPTAMYTGTYTNDVGIGLAFSFGNIAAGDSVTFAYAYVLKASDLTAALNSTVSTWTATGDTSSSILSKDTAYVCKNRLDTVTLVDTGATSWSWISLTGETLSTYTGTHTTVSVNVTPVQLLAIGLGSGCAGANDTVYMTIVPTVPSVTATSNSPVCAGSPINFTGSPSATGTTYFWTGPAGFTSTSQDPTISSAVAGDAGTYRFSEVFDGCVSDTATTSVTVSTVTPAALSPATSTICPGGHETLLDATGGGVWTSSNTTIATVSGGVVTGVTTGMDTVTYAIGGCTATATVSVNATLSAITGTFTVCGGATTTLVETATGGTWSSSNTAVASVGSTGIVMGGSVSVPTTAIITYTAGGGCAASAIVTVNPAAAAMSGSSGAVCAGLTTTFLETGSGSWSSSNTLVATVGSSTGTVTGVATAGGTATITYTLSTGCHTTTIVTVDPLPAAIAPANPVICIGGTITLTDATTGGVWSSSTTGIVTVTSGGIISGVAAGTATIDYTEGSCSASTIVTVSSAPPITGNLVACAGTGAPTDTLSDATSGGIWSSGNLAVAIITSTGWLTGVSAGTATITDSVGPGCTVTVIVTVNPEPTIAFSSPVTGLVTSIICVGTDAVSSVGPGGGTWSSSNTSVTTTSAAVGVAYGVSDGTSIITYTVGGCYATSVLTVAASSAISPLTSAVCVGGTVMLTEASTSGVWSSSNTSLATVSSSGVVSAESLGTDTISYQVYIGAIPVCAPYMATVDVTSGAGSITPSTAISFCSGTTTTLVDATTGGVWSSDNTGVATVSTSGVVGGVTADTVTITYNVGSCNTSKVVTVTASPAALSPSSATVCSGTTVSLTETTSGGAWSSSATGTATVTSGGIVSGVAAGTATIAYTAGSCLASAVVTVANTPAAIGPPTAIVLCAASTTTLTESVTGGTWSSNATGTATVSSAGIVTGVATGTATISYISGSCFVTNTVTVSTSPAAISPSSPTVCTGTTVSLTETITGGAWSSSATGTATVSSTGIVSGVAAGTSSIAYLLGTCSATAVVTVANTPAAIAPSTAIVLCAASTATLTESVTGGTWSSNATGIATVSAMGVVKGVATGTATISYISGSCFVTTTVTVNTSPAAISPSSPTVCTGTTASLTETITGGTWSSSATGTATVSSAGVVGGIAAGTTTIAYSLGTCSASAIVTVANTPAAITPSAAIVFCAATTTTLVESVTGGTWSSGATGTATVSSAGVVTGVTGGTAVISYSAGSCYVTKTVTVSPGPVALLPASPTVCTGSTLSITDAVSGGTWSSSATAAATVSSTGVVSGVAPGSVNISYTIGSCVATDAVTVILTPTVSAVSGTTSLCVGVTTSLTEVATDGIWSSSNSAAATVSSAGIVYGAGVGTTTISYTITSGCGVIGAALVMTVNTTPSAGTITGSASMCSGTTLQLSNTVTGGSWSSSNSSASVNSATGLVTGISPGPDTITYTVTTPCGTASTTKVITIGAYLSAGTIAGTAILCGGSTVHLTDVVTGGTWSSSNSSATVGSTGIVTGAVTGGMDTISYTVTASCGSAVATDIIDVYPTAIAGTMSGVSTLCTGSTATFTETATGGVWSSHNSNATVTGGGLVTAVSAGSDIISYSVSNSCGTSVATVNVTISSATPTAGTITGSGSVCAGTPVALTDAVSGGVWSSSNTNASVSSAGMVIALASGLDTISYTLSTSCGTAIATFVISANGTVPTAGAITGASGICVGYPIAFTSTVSGGTWSISNSHATISSAGLVSGVTSGADTVTYAVSTSCGTAATTVAVTIGTTTAGAGSISGASTVCTGSSLILTDGTAGGAWSSSNTNATVIGGTVTGMTAGAAIISYSITYSCGIAYATNSITITPSSPISAITGPVTVCVGSTINLTDATPGGSWSSSNTNVTVSGGEVMGVTLGTSTVSYTVISSCGTGSALSVITIVAASTVTLAPISGISIVCVGSGITLTDASPGGIWLASNAHATVVGPGIIDGISPGIDTIGYLVTGVCGNVEVTKILSVDTLPTVAPIAGPSSQCVGSTIALSDPTAGGIWTASIPAVGTPDLSTGVVTGLSAGTTIISYTVTNLYGCPNTVTLTDAVTPSSITTAITGSASVCLGSATTLSNATLGGTWSSSNTAVAVIDLATGSVTGLAPGTTTISYTVAGSCGIATITSVETVNTFPVVSAISGSPTVCAGAATVLGDAGAGGVWSSRNTAIAVVNPTNGTVTGVSGGTDEIYYLIANSCGSAIDSTSITVYPGPAVDAITAAYTALCTGNTLDVSDATAGGVWVSSNTAIAAVSSAGAILGRAAGEDTIYYVVTNSRGCSSAAMVSITIGGAIVSATVDPAGAVELCQSHTVYMDVASSGGFTYQWLRNGIAITGATLSGYTTSATGNYSVILSNGICSETVTGPSVITPALPVISFTPPDKLSTGTYASYQWFLNGVLIAGATESTTDETGGGIYTVVVTDAQGCSDTSSGYTLGAAGVNNINAPQDIKVYPNPATSVVHIESPVQVNVSVLSIDGKLLIQQNNATDVDVSALADGMYMILVYDQSGLLLKTAKLAKLE